MALKLAETKFGAVRGIPAGDRYEDITEFRGIPYAAPPIGDLRFAPPEDPEPWQGELMCDTYAPAAMQTYFDNKRADEVYYRGVPEMSEDCLYLNVITPAEEPGRSYPVYIWYHDGGLTNGFSYGMEVNPLPIVSRGVIVVQVGHRIGHFGYLSLPQLTERYGSSGNYGFMDTLKALRWVYENIEAFGGDPERITIGGQSGGTSKCCALVACPQAKGMVKGVFNQSGLCWLSNMMTQEDSDALGRQYLEAVGIDPDISVEELRRLDTFDIHKEDAPFGLIPRNMVIDGVYFDDSFRKCFEKNIGGVSFMNSSTLGEGDVFAKPRADKNAAYVFGKPMQKKEQFYDHFKKVLGDLYDLYDFESIVPVTDENCWDTALHLASYGLAERGRGTNPTRSLMVNRVFGALLQKMYPENRVYTMLFSHLQPQRTDYDPNDPEFPEETLAPHGSDMWYAYGSLGEGTPPVRKWRDSDYYVSYLLMNYLINFIKRGDPNGVGLPKWPRGGDNYGWMDISAEPKAHVGLEGKTDELIRDFIVRYYNVDL